MTLGFQVPYPHTIWGEGQGEGFQCCCNNDFLRTLVYILYMRKVPLIKTNPYLKDPVKRNEGIARSVASSSAIEGIRCSLDATQVKERSGTFVDTTPYKSSASKKPR